MARLTWHMHCRDTTEAGEDEIYLVVTSKKSDGTVTNARLLNNDGRPWNMNTSEDNDPTYDFTVDLIRFDDLSPGESMTVIVSVLEEDGGSPDDWINYSTALAETIPNNVTSEISSVLGLVMQFMPDMRDTDCHIGTFKIDLTYRESDGYTVAEWSHVDDCRSLGQTSGPRSNGFNFWGDGSDYYGWGEMFLQND